MAAADGSGQLGALGWERFQPVCGNSACCSPCAADGRRLHRCKRCRRTYYCSYACHRTDWARHKHAECVGGSAGPTARDYAAAALAALYPADTARRMLDSMDALSTSEPNGLFNSSNALRAERLLESVGGIAVATRMTQAQLQNLRAGLAQIYGTEVSKVEASLSAARN